MSGILSSEEAEKQRQFLKSEAELQRAFEEKQAKAQTAFERDKASYHENSEHLRDLNKFLWQVPLIAMTLTGGLWYGIAHEAIIADIRSPLLAFACLANVGFIIIIIRVRYVFEQILKASREFNPGATAHTQGASIIYREGVVVTVFCVLMGIAAIMSLVGAINPTKMFSSNSTKASALDTKALRDRAYHQADTN